MQLCVTIGCNYVLLFIVLDWDSYYQSSGLIVFNTALSIRPLITNLTF